MGIKSIYYGLALLIIVLDQITKILAEQHLSFAEPVAILPLLNFTLLYNEGAAFSMFSQFGGWQRWFLSALSAIASVVLIIWLYRLPSKEKLTGIALALILGGAMGNLIDRLIYGHVIDFIDFYYQADSCLPLFGRWLDGGCHWPAFNIADSAISVGAVLILFISLYDMFIKQKQAS